MNMSVVADVQVRIHAPGFLQSATSIGQDKTVSDLIHKIKGQLDNKYISHILCGGKPFRNGDRQLVSTLDKNEQGGIDVYVFYSPPGQSVQEQRPQELHQPKKLIF